ncbi:MAG: D-alanine--D-alanine ligase, partial [Chlorobi bacterium]|nr:D-alanine--D-alanine ligase [Chlorobiota bacterium]
MNHTKFRVGIFFGGASREREISFSGGRTVFDNLNREVFDPIPIFVDSLGNLILLDWKYLYKGTIRDFYPVPELLSEQEKSFQIYIESIEDSSQIDKHISKIGKRISYEDLLDLIDFAYLVLHGPFGEDGTLQGMLEFMGIPYSNSGIFPTALSVDKTKVKKQFELSGKPVANGIVINRKDWLRDFKSVLDNHAYKFFNDVKRVVVKPANQGSSIGVSFVDSIESLQQAIDKAFFLKRLDISQWKSLSDNEKYRFIRDLVDPRYSIGFPVIIYDEQGNPVSEAISSPLRLMNVLDSEGDLPEKIVLAGFPIETHVLVEEALEGKEFSCIVLENSSGEPVALLPTEILKAGRVFDYRSKYLAGMARKRTPARLPIEKIQKIRLSSQEAYKLIGCDVYARIDGFLTTAGEVIINDPNTTSGMLPSSLLFHQTALIGMGPSEFLTYSIFQSLNHRINSPTANVNIFSKGENLHSIQSEAKEKTKERVAVIMGGYSSERHISVESGRNIFEKLLASEHYEPIPLFLLKNETGDLELYKIPL